jgi:hypothetical protein
LGSNFKPSENQLIASSNRCALNASFPFSLASLIYIQDSSKHQKKKLEISILEEHAKKKYDSSKENRNQILTSQKKM